MLNRPPPGLWDSFWAEHASSDRPFHRLLWYIRFVFSFAYARALARTPRVVARPGPVLEVGCGSARTLHYMRRYLPEQASLAFDLSPLAVRLARRLTPSFRGVVSEAGALPLAPAVCSLAFSIGLIEHFDRATAGALVREMVRVAQPGGLVAVMVPWRSSFYNLIRQVFGARWPFGHENPFRRAELVKFMRAQGVTDVRLHVVYFSTLLVIGRKPLE